VVRVYDFGVDRDRRPFLVMELLEGETLRQRLAASAPMGDGEALHILRGVCSALDAAHSQGLVHRDLKPENIFLQRHDTGDVPKVLDFGLAKAFDLRASPRRTTMTGSSAGLLVGTLEYMAPEQVAGDEVSPLWDVWALSIIAYEMLTGSHPFRRTVAFSTGGPAAGLERPRHTNRSPLSEGGLALFRAALSTEAACRPANALTFLTALEQVLA
jgi:serine/threonine-protein kinase